MQATPNLPQFRTRPSAGRGIDVVPEDRDKKLQNEAIAELSLETGWRVEDIGPLYRRVFHELEQNAQVHDYLFVLTAKQVRRMLNKRKQPKRREQGKS